MALPATLTPSSPEETDSPAQGASQIRGIKQYLVDVFGAPSGTPVTIAPFSFTAAGILSFTGSPLNVPSMIQGTPSTLLVINAQYLGIQNQVASNIISNWTRTGLLLNQVFIEGATTMKVGTQGPQSLFFRTNSLDRAVVGPTGMVGIGQGSPQYPLHISGTTAATQRIQIDDTSTTAGTILLGSQTFPLGTATAMWVGSVAGASMPLGLVAGNGAVMLLDNRGSVGINNLAPFPHALSVNGSTLATSTSIYPGGPIRCDATAGGRLVLPVGSGLYAT